MRDQSQKKNNYQAIDPLLSRDEVAAELGVSAGTVDRYRRSGVLPEPARLGGRPRWRLSVIETAKGSTAAAA